MKKKKRRENLNDRKSEEGVGKINNEGMKKGQRMRGEKDKR